MYLRLLPDCCSHTKRSLQASRVGVKDSCYCPVDIKPAASCFSAIQGKVLAYRRSIVTESTVHLQIDVHLLSVTHEEFFRQLVLI